MRKLWLSLIVIVSGIFLTGCNADAITQIFEYKSKSGIQVITDGVASAVYLDDQYLNNTPLIEKNLKPGSYKIKIEPIDDQFVAYETTVQLNKGTLTVVTWKPGTRPELSGGVIYEMEKIDDKNKSQIDFNSVPDGAIVMLDDQKKEFSPVLFDDVAAGNREFEITLPSYETQRHTLNVQPGHRVNVSVKLAKLVPVEETMPTVSSEESSDDTQDQTNLSAELNASAGAKPKDKRIVVIEPTGLIQDGKEVLRVRAAAEITADELGLAEVGETFPYLGETENSWYKIQFDDREGWVSAEFAEITTPEDLNE